RRSCRRRSRGWSSSRSGGPRWPPRSASWTRRRERIVSRVGPWAILDIDPERIQKIVRAALEEDVGSRDATTEATVEAEARATGVLVAKEPLLVAGLDVALEVFRAVDPAIAWETRAREGDRFEKGNLIASITGPARGILTG